jgi:CubicO group peptidase (beta-lactamase class C family)
MPSSLSSYTRHLAGVTASASAAWLLTPLGMSRSGVGSNAGGIPLPGHDHRGELRHWDHPLAAAGGVEATIGDLARYTSACLRPPPSPLGAAITAAQTPVEAGGHKALAWPTPRSRSPTGRSACGSASSRRARSQA